MIRTIEKVLETVSVLLLVMLVLLISLQIFTRFIGSSFIWTEELSRYTLVYITFLGGALAYYKGEGLRITFLVDRFPDKVKKINNAVILILTIFLLLFTVYVSIKFTISLWDSKTTALQWDKGLIAMSLPIGFSLVLLKLIRECKGLLSAK